jgi:hypothetical protein
MIPTLITESSPTRYVTDHGITPHLVHPSRAPASRAFGNGLEWKGLEGSLKLTSGLWLLVVETLILNIISQRARPMMIGNQP